MLVAVPGQWREGSFLVGFLLESTKQTDQSYRDGEIRNEKQKVLFAILMALLWLKDGPFADSALGLGL